MNLIPPLIDSIQAHQVRCLTDIYGDFVKSLWSECSFKTFEIGFPSLLSSYTCKQGRLPHALTEGQSAVCRALWKYPLVSIQILKALHITPAIQMGLTTNTTRPVGIEE